MKKSHAIFVGLLAYLVCSAPFGGIPFLLMTVICTLGATLLLWLPVFWLIGFVILSIFKIFSSEDKPSEKPLDKNQMVFIQYIQKERAAGVSDQQIALALKNVGWTDSDIQAAFKHVDSIK